MGILGFIKKLFYQLLSRGLSFGLDYEKNIAVKGCCMKIQGNFG